MDACRMGVAVGEVAVYGETEERLSDHVEGLRSTAKETLCQQYHLRARHRACRRSGRMSLADASFRGAVYLIAKLETQS